MPRQLFQMFFDGGLNTSAPKEFIRPNELTEAVGIYYPQGSAPKTEKIPGRATLKTFPAGVASKGLRYISFDDPAITDRLLAYAGSGLYTSVANTGSAMTYDYQVSPSGQFMHVAHFNDRNYICYGAGTNLVYDSTLTFRQHGMVPPYELQMSDFRRSYGSTPFRVSGYTVSGLTGVWRDGQYAYDLAYASGLYAEGTPLLSGLSTITYSGFMSEPAVSGAYINLNFSTSVGANKPPGGFEINDIFGWGGDPGSATWDIRVSYNRGVAWSGIKTGFFITSFPQTDIQIPVPTGIDVNDIFVGAAITCTNAYENAEDHLRIWDISLFNSSGLGDINTPAFDASGLSYGVTEYDSANDLESVAWTTPVAISLSEFNGDNSVVVTLPQGSLNPNSTHYRIYRTTDNGVAPSELGLIGEVQVNPSGTVQFVDKFTITKDTVALPKYPMLGVASQQEGVVTYYEWLRKPTAWSHVTAYQGSLVGVDANNPRTLWYTPPGYPEYSPEPYAIRSFPMPDHDVLVGSMAVGEVLIVLAQDGVFEVRGLPLVGADSTYATSLSTRLPGAPGCVGPRAFTELPDETGNPAGAWVAKDGVYVTDGLRYRRITDEIDWRALVPTSVAKSKIVLFWHNDLKLLVMYYPHTSGENSRFITIHLRQLKESGFPKITGPHYARVRDITAGYLSDNYQAFSIDSTLGFIYYELYGVHDQSQSYNNTQAIPVSIKTGRIYSPESYTDMEIAKFNIRHNDWTDYLGEAIAGINFHYGYDTATFKNGLKSFNNVNLSGYRGTEVNVSQTCEWFEVGLVASGIPDFTKLPKYFLSDLRIITNRASEAGDR